MQLTPVLFHKLWSFSVCGFEAFINGKHIVGQVKEKEQAHKEYREAISKGHGAYLMDEETPVSCCYHKDVVDIACIFTVLHYCVRWLDCNL